MDNQKFIQEMGKQVLNFKEKPGRLYFEIRKEDIRKAAEHLFNKMGCRLSTATAQESYRGIEVMYHFSHDATGKYYCPIVVLDKKKEKKMDSITPVVQGAEWIEREMSEMFGIIFQGLPNPEPLLTGNHPGNIKTPWIHMKENYE